MSICARVYTPRVEIPPELRTYNDDGSRIERSQEEEEEIQRKWGLDKKYASQDRKEDNVSIMSGLSGDTLQGDARAEEKGGKRSLLRKVFHGGKEKVEDGKQ